MKEINILHFLNTAKITNSKFVYDKTKIVKMVTIITVMKITSLLI